MVPKTDRLRSIQKLTEGCKYHYLMSKDATFKLAMQKQLVAYANKIIYIKSHA